MLLWYSVQWVKHYRKDYMRVLFYQVDHVLVIPEIQRSFGNLDTQLFYCWYQQSWLTWKWGLDTHLASCLNNASCILMNCSGSTMSNISSNSPRNITYQQWLVHIKIECSNNTSFGLFVFGQNFNNPLTTLSVKDGSFSRNCTTQYASCAWYWPSVFDLCRGIRTLTRNCLCSAFSGNANPLIMLKE